MIKVTPDFERAVEAAVQEAEAHTDAELVVVVAPQSGTYRDLPFALASAASLVLLALVVALPFEFHPWLAVIEIGLAWPAFAWVFSAAPVCRTVASATRKREQVAAAAAAEFHREMVHSTPARVGVLVYLSILEQQVEVIADVGIQGRIPNGEWDVAARPFAQHDPESFAAGIASIGAVLRAHIPPVADAPRLELADAPRIRR